MEKLMIKVENISKEYRLGQIGGTTLRDELQRLHARRRGLEDPTRKIGARSYRPGETFLALDGVSFEVTPGERIGIIGHNGAGKSTLLKLLCRVTAPTDGFIGLNGRIASMLEVGTGFHPELTGRENVYMNGAILGMTRREIDRKIEDIIDFSEVRQFIDTPVKRYSSGMYVKLAFSVAAHLDSEIMIMDEVLAVGDMAFQSKCLQKMGDVSKTEGRTILYVSHNMNTIRQLCSRVIVLDHGHIVFDGGVEEGIEKYLGDKRDFRTYVEYQPEHHNPWIRGTGFEIRSMNVPHADQLSFERDGAILLTLGCRAEKEIRDVFFRFELKTRAGVNVGTVFSTEPVSFDAGDSDVQLRFDLHHLAPGEYFANFAAYYQNEFGRERLVDGIYPGLAFEVRPQDGDLLWNKTHWGPVHLHDLSVESVTR